MFLSPIFEILFDHIEIVFSDFTPRTWHNFTTLHHKYILAGFRAKLIRFATKINFSFGFQGIDKILFA